MLHGLHLHQGPRGNKGSQPQESQWWGRLTRHIKFLGVMIWKVLWSFFPRCPGTSVHSGSSGRQWVVRTSVPEEAGVAEEHSGSHEEGSSQEGLMPLPPSTVQHRGKSPTTTKIRLSMRDLSSSLVALNLPSTEAI